MSSPRSRAKKPAAPALRKTDPAHEPPAAPPAAASRSTRIACLLALAALAFASRGAVFGEPVADDYDYLYAVTFAEDAANPFSGLGASLYWRPLSRQLWIALARHWMLAAPWIETAIHAALLLGVGLLLRRLVARSLPLTAQIAIATFPLLAEPARVLLVWPSGIQYLLAMLFVLLSLRAAWAGRFGWSALAAGAAGLSHELGALALAFAPAAAWWRGARGGAWLRAGGPTALAAVLLLAGQWWATRSGVVQPGGSDLAKRLLSIPELLGVAMAAQLNLEDLPPNLAALIVGAYVAVLLAATGRFAAAPAARRRLRAAAPWIAGGCAWWLLATVPLVLLLPGWNGWRTSVGGLGLAVAGVAVVSAAWPWLAGAFAAIRMVALLLAAPGPAHVEMAVPASSSGLSLVRIARLQRIVASTREHLLSAHPRLPRGARIRHWSIPNVSMIGFAESRAARVWYGDSTLTWENYSDAELEKPAADAVLAFDTPSPDPAVAIAPEALRLLLAGRACSDDLPARADSLFALVVPAQARRSRVFEDLVVRHRARAALRLGAPQRADSLNRRSFELSGETANYWIVEAYLALGHADSASAAGAIRRALQIDPRSVEANWIAGHLGLERAP